MTMSQTSSTPLSPAARIRRAVLGWSGVEEAPHRFGGVEFRLGRRELGHLHGDHLADLPFPVRVREELVQAGRRVTTVAVRRGFSAALVDVINAVASHGSSRASRKGQQAS